MLTLCRALIELGHECHVAISPGGRLEQICREADLRIVPVPMNGLFAAARLRAWLRPNPVDVVPSHLTGAARIGLDAARGLDLPLFSHLHIYRADKAYARDARYTRGCLIAVSQHLAAWFRERLARDEAQVRVVVNSTWVRETPEAAGDRSTLAGALTAELGLPPAARLLCLAGRLSHDKGQDIAIRALGELSSTHPDAHLLLAGVAKRGSSVERELRALAAEVGVAQRVHFLGFRRDVPRLMRAADVCLLPSRLDVMPLVAIEALRLGCCLVAARVGGLPELVVEGRTGLLVDPDSPTALANAVGRLLSDTTTVEALRAQARDYAVEAFDPMLMTRKIVSLYTQAAQPHGGTVLTAHGSKADPLHNG